MRPNYGNWLSNKKLRTMGCCCLATAMLLSSLILFSSHWTLITFASILFLITAFIFVYMFIHHRELSFDGGGLMGRIHEYVLQHLTWDGKGMFLDVGCGSGALTIKSAKLYPYAECVGIDNWDPKWDFNQEMCTKNALIEGVGEQCKFLTEDASRIEFPDKYFDAVVSNLVYFHVSDNPNKEALLIETLRVLKDGGAFSLLDHFCQDSIYGDFNETIAHLKAAGISEIHFIPHVENEIPIPRWMLLNGKLANLGILYGRK